MIIDENICDISDIKIIDKIEIESYNFKIFITTYENSKFTNLS